MKGIFVAVLALAISHHLFAQSITGRVVDAVDQQPIEYASVVVYSAGDSSMVNGGMTGADGAFTLESLKSGPYYVTVTFMGYLPKTVGNIDLRGNANHDLGTILVSRSQQMLEEVVVSGEQVTQLHKIDRQVYAADNFESARGGNAADVLRNLPSVTMDAEGQISVRGTTGFVVMLNGKPVQTDPSVLLNQLPANAIQDIEIITAPSAAYDPEGKAGIINITTSRGASDGTFIQANAKVGMPSIEDYDNAESAPKYGADFTLNYRKKRWDISLGGSYLRNDITGRRVGDVYTIENDTLTRFPSDGERSSDALSYSGRFTVGYNPDERNNLSLGFYAGKRTTDRLADIVYYDNHAVYPASSGERLYTLQYFNHNLRTRRGDFVLGSLDYTHTFKNTSAVSASALYEYTMLGGPTINQNVGWPNTETMYQDEYNTNDNPLHGFRFQADYKSKPLTLGTIAAGYQYRNLDHTGDFYYGRKNAESGEFELVPEFSSTVNLKRSIHSFYGQLAGTKGKLSYGLGVRMEWMDRELELKDKTGTFDSTYYYDFLKPYPSANILYAINDGLNLKAAYSRRVERTTTFKMNPFPEREHSETLEQGDPTLLPEFIDLVEVGAVKYLGENSISFTSYLRNVKNVINRVNTVYNDSILNRIYSNVGNSRSVGFDLSTELKLSPWWKLFASGNVYYYDIKGSFDNRPVNTSNWAHSINANTTFDISESLHFQFNVSYMSERVTAQGVDSRFLSPGLSIRKTFLGDKLSATLQWMNIDMGLLPTNEQRITTWREGEFYTTTNYIYEVDVIMLNLSYSFNKAGNKARFIKSEFGEKEF